MSAGIPRSGKSGSAVNEEEIPAVIPLLYVDDEPDQLFLCKSFLEQTGYFQVDTTDSPCRALQMIRLVQYTVIVSDYQMPEMNGLEFLAEVGRNHGHLPLVLFTSRSREEVGNTEPDTRVDFYVQKTGNARAQYTALGRVVMNAAASRQRELPDQEPESGGIFPTDM